MSEQVGIDIVLRGQTQGGDAVKAALDKVLNSADKVTGAVDELERRMRSASSSANMFSRSLAAVGSVFGVREIIRMADSITSMEGRLKNATRSAEEASQAFSGLRDIAMHTGSGLEAVTSVYQRLSFVRDEIKASNGEMLQFTDTVSKLGVVSGAGTEALRAGLTQLGQALSSGYMRAEEFNSIMENIPAVGVEIAKQFGVTTGELRALVVQGKVLSSDVFSAIINSAKTVNDQFKNMPSTIGRAFSQMMTEITGAVSEIDKATNASKILVGTLGFVGSVSNIFAGLARTLQGLVAQMTGVISAAIAAALEGVQKLINLGVRGINYFRSSDNQIAPVNFISEGKASAFLKAGSLSGNDFFDKAGDSFQKVWGNSSDLEKVASATREISQNYGDIAKKVQDKGAQAALKDALKQHDALTDAIRASWTEEEQLVDKIKELESMRGMKMTKEEAQGLETAISRAKDQLENLKFEKLRDVIKDSMTAEEKLVEKIKEMESLRGLAKTSGDASGLETAIKRANAELDEMHTKAEVDGPLGKAFAGLAGQVDSGFREAFEDAFTSANSGWDSLMNGFKSTFKRMLADIAYAAIARPIVVSVLGAIGGGAGLSSAAQASILGSTTGGGGDISALGNLGSLSSVGGLLSGGLYSSTLGNYGAQLGAYLSGDGLLSSSALIGAQTLGNVAYGAFGSLGANLLGLGSSNTLVNIGSGLAGTLAGGAVGSTMGTILGFAGGPAGAIIGSFLGTALGGLFGNSKPSNKEQWGSLNLGDLTTFNVGGQSGKKFSQENADFRDGVLNQAKTFATLLQSIGGTTSGTMGVGIGSRDGLRLYSDGSLVATYNTAQQVLEAAMKEVADHTTGLADTYTSIIKKLGFSDMTALGDALNFGKYFESIVNPADTVAEAIKAVNANFDDMIKKASDLGLVSDKFTTEMEKQREAQVGLIKAQQAGYQSLEAMKSGFDSWLYDQSIGSTSSLSPTEKLLAAQGNFGSVLSDIQGGDYSKTQQLLEAGNQLLQLGQSMYASSVDFTTLEKFVRDSISSVARELGVPGYASGTRSATAGVRWVGENGPELVRFSGGERVYNAEESKVVARQGAQNDTRFAEMNDRMASMDDTMRRMERQLGRVANRLTVVAA